MSKHKKPENSARTILTLLKYMSRYKLRLIIAVICAVVTPICAARATYYLKPAINDYIVPMIGMTEVDLTAFVGILAKMAGLYIAVAILKFLETRFMTQICQDTIYDIRSDMFRHMQGLSLGYFDTHTRGSLMSMYASDVNTLTTMLKQSIPQLINGIVSIVSILASMIYLNKPLTLVVLAYMIFVIVFNRYIIGQSSDYSRKTQQEIASMNSFVEEMLEGQELVNLYQREERLGEQFEHQSEELYHASVGSKVYSNAIFCISSALSNIGFAIVSMAGVLFVLAGYSDIGTVCAFVMYYKDFHAPVVQATRQIGNVFIGLAGAERIFKMLEEPPECNEGQDRFAGDVDSRITESISFNDMSFGYKKDHPVLRNIDLKVTAGQRIAFVGSSGAGKTTIASLLTRFYDVNEGSITIDGKDIRSFDKYELRNQISMVLQDTHLFTGTIRDNIRFGRLDATDGEVEEIARLVHADFFIEHLPEGYDTFLTADGEMLSEGQRQLLAIARAAIAKSPILIMDEATSSVDTYTEQQIELGMNALMEGKTVFIIAHRLSTVRSADVIVVLKDGRIVECGNHEELMELKGMYYDLNTGSSELL